MGTVLEIHLGFAFFVFVLGLFIGWVQLGRVVLLAVIGIQVLIGALVAAWAGVSHTPLPGTLWIHILGGLLAMGAYAVALRVVDRDERRYRLVGWCISLAGFALIVLTAWYGVSLYRVYGI